MDRERKKKMITTLLMTAMLAATLVIMTGCGSEDSGASCREILDGCKKIALRTKWVIKVSWGMIF